MSQKPNVLFILTDEWQAQALGYMGNTQVQTPCLDALAQESWNCTHAISTVPVCCPMRATLLTGLLPDRHGVFTNDVHLDQRFVSIADCFNIAGYDTGWIGKWHVDGHGRAAYIPPERRQGFRYFEGLECEHGYNTSKYYLNDDPERKIYDGYDADCQTESALRYMKEQRDNPFALFLSWGPPHFPLHSAPQDCKDLYDPARLELAPNVDESHPGDEVGVREDTAGYYAHCSALDRNIGKILVEMSDAGLLENTLIVFTSDHGDMMYAHGCIHKQKPYDESIRVPLLIRPPNSWQADAWTSAQPIGLLDMVPTLCGLCEVPAPPQAQGTDYSGAMRTGGGDWGDNDQFIAGYGCFGEYERGRGGIEWRGFRSGQYTFAVTRDGPWQLYDNQADPYQMNNLVAEWQTILPDAEQRMQQLLARFDDAFPPESVYLERWGWPVNKNGTVPFSAESGVGASPHAGAILNGLR